MITKNWDQCLLQNSFALCNSASVIIAYQIRHHYSYLVVEDNTAWFDGHRKYIGNYQFTPLSVNANLYLN